MRRWFWLLVVVIVAAIAVLLSAYRVFEDLAGGRTGTAPQRILDEVAGGVTALALMPGVAWLARRFPVRRGQILRSVPPHFIGLVAYSIAHTFLLSLAHGALYPLIGFSADPYTPKLLARAFQELAHDVMAYGLFLGLDAAWSAAETLRAIELRTLRLQLQPHFLFNALNTISEAIHDAPRAAEAMLEHLAELLRLSLRMEATHEVPLAEELVALGRYTALLEARFGDRLRVCVEVAAEAEPLLVPSLLLQPLVENALRHGATGQPLEIDVSARREGAELIIEVADNGPGADPDADVMQKGLGLAASAERLRLLYRGRAKLTAGNRPEGGFAVRLRIPARPG